MRVLHVVKTSEGAQWAARQARVLVNRGVDVHVALPLSKGCAVEEWVKAGARIHIVDCGLPLNVPILFKKNARKIKSLIEEVQPNLIHSHFVTTTVMLRLVLGKTHQVPIVFQVPGPLHLEHRLYRWAEISTAGKNDYWIASSQYTHNLYLQQGIPANRLFLSYYGININGEEVRSKGSLYKKLGIQSNLKIVGNISFMYPPKFYLGHKRGIKGHEDIIDALKIVGKTREDVMGVLIGGQWGNGCSYEKRLQALAKKALKDRIIMPGRVDFTDALSLWTDFSCVVHVPFSENCGGVVEPLLYGVPTIASNIGGLPEVVIDGVTGWLVPPGNPQHLAAAILNVLEDRESTRFFSQVGRQLILKMFDVNRTAEEIFNIYNVILGKSSNVSENFDSGAYALKISSAIRN